MAAMDAARLLEAEAHAAHGESPAAAQAKG
jgi:hypothetical protein